MSIEKLRADTDGEIASCDKDQSEHGHGQEKVCAICDRYEILRALLNEHEMTLEFGGDDLDGSGTWQKAEKAIQRYGESE